MDLNHSFTVNQPIAETWNILTDLERIAPCLAGAQLEEIEGDVFKGGVKIKVGPIVAQFKGEAQFADKDDDNFRAVLKASGRDIGGKGNATATITATLTPVTASSTTCTVVTDLAITGKVAQFGRGALADISEKLIAQFADNLNTLIDAEGGSPRESPSATQTTHDDTSAEPRIRKIDGPAAEPLNLQSVAGSALLKRLLPIVGGVLFVVGFLRRIRRRRRR